MLPIALFLVSVVRRFGGAVTQKRVPKLDHSHSLCYLPSVKTIVAATLADLGESRS